MASDLAVVKGDGDHLPLDRIPSGAEKQVMSFPLGLRASQDDVQAMSDFSPLQKRVWPFDPKEGGFLSRKRLAATVFSLAGKGVC